MATSGLKQMRNTIFGLADDDFCLIVDNVGRE